jgi:hypothetical protein
MDRLGHRMDLLSRPGLPMSDFDFVTDQALRASLESDYAEMLRCFEAEAWKAVQVLAGSIVEALLVDHLLSTAADQYPKEQLLSMSLGELLVQAKSLGTLTKKTCELSGAIREYRNLIHPGRLIRLSESIKRPDATVAVSVVDIITREVGSARETVCGPTAEAIVDKLRRDPGSSYILSDLLADVRDDQIELLLTHSIPEAHFSDQEDSWEGQDKKFQSNLERAYRVAFGAAKEPIRKAVMKHVVGVVRTEEGSVVDNTLLRFLEGSDLDYLPQKDREAVLNRLLPLIRDESQLSERIAFYPALRPYLTAQQRAVACIDFTSALARNVYSKHYPQTSRLAKDFYFSLTASEQAVFRQRLSASIEFHKERDQTPQAQRLEKFVSVLDEAEFPVGEDIPF